MIVEAEEAEATIVNRIVAHPLVGRVFTDEEAARGKYDMQGWRIQSSAKVSISDAVESAVQSGHRMIEVISKEYARDLVALHIKAAWFHPLGQRDGAFIVQIMIKR